MKSRLFLQIFGTYLFLILLTTLVVGVFVGQHMKGVLEDRIEEDLLTYARLIETGSSGGLKANLKTLAEISGSRITIIDAKGTVIADSEIVPPGTESHLNRPEIQEARVKGSVMHLHELPWIRNGVGTKSVASGCLQSAQPYFCLEPLTVFVNHGNQRNGHIAD